MQQVNKFRILDVLDDVLLTDVDLSEPDVADDVIDHLCGAHVAPHRAWSSQFCVIIQQHASSSPTVLDEFCETLQQCPTHHRTFCCSAAAVMSFRRSILRTYPEFYVLSGFTDGIDVNE